MPRMMKLRDTKNYRSLIDSWVDQGKDWVNLSLSDLSELEAFANVNDRAGLKAQGLLILNGEYIIDDPVYLPNNGEPRSLSFFGNHKEDNGTLIAFPNPAKEFFTVEYRIGIPYEKGILQIHDMKGSLVFEELLTRNENQIIVENSFENGNYKISILIDGKMYNSSSIVLND